MNAVVAEVASTDRSPGTKTLLPFQTPSLILRVMNGPFCAAYCRQREIRNRSLNLSESLTAREPVEKSHIRSCRIFEQVSFFVGGEIVLLWGKRVVGRDVTRKRIEDAIRQRVIENANATADYRITRETERLPGETKSRRPQDVVNPLKSVFLVNQDRPIVRRVRVMVERFKWSNQPGIATTMAKRIGVMLRPQG